jgi:hypothetical protein
MTTLRELASESIGKITRRSLEPQIEQADQALASSERVLAVAPGHDGGAGILVVATDRRVLISRGAPFTTPELVDVLRAGLVRATAVADASEWRLDLDHLDGRSSVGGMFDRDAQRLAALLSPAAPEPTDPAAED